MSTATTAFVRSRDRRLDGGRIEVERVRVDVGEDGHAALVDEAVRRRRERERRGDHLVAGPDPRGAHAEVETRGAARDRRAVRRAHIAGEALLELLRDGTEREPPRPEHLRDQLDLALADHRLRERDLLDRCRHASAGVAT